MNTTDSYSPNYNQDIVNRDDTETTTTDAQPAVAAIFGDREAAHDAVHRLHDEGYRDTWIGIARSDESVDYTMEADAAAETRIESENWFTRFFGEGDESLHDALLRRGVSESDARVSGTIAAGSAVLTVNGLNHPELAAQIITQSGGRVITRGFGATGYGTAGMLGDDRQRAWTETAQAAGATGSQAPAPRTTSLYDEGVASAATSAGQRDLHDGSADLRGTNASTAAWDPNDATQDRLDSGRLPVPSDATQALDATVYDDYGRYRAGMPVDESTRLQLREERLRIDKSRVSRGEATIATDVVTETQNIDVPLIREELFVERRPVSGSDTGKSSPIGSTEIIRVPLVEEKLIVTKVPVVTEEVVIGKREVEDVQHISETTRKETLSVSDTSAAVTTGRGVNERR